MASRDVRASKARRSFFTHDDEDAENGLTEKQRRRRKIKSLILLVIKLTVFIAIWLFFTTVLIITAIHKKNEKIILLVPHQPFVAEINEKPSRDEICVEIRGNIDVDVTQNPKMASEDQSYFILNVESFNSESNTTDWKLKEWKVFVLDASKQKLTTVKQNFELPDSKDTNSDSKLQLSFHNPSDKAICVVLWINTNPMNINVGVGSAAALLVVLYILIIFDITDRTFAALLMATTAVGVICVIGERPMLHEIIAWIDMETLMLLFSMMIMVGVLAETGVFEYFSVVAYRISKGQPWTLLFLICMLTVLLSAFLDNVTIIMLMVPIVIRLCESMGLRTTTVLICVVIFSNIGGALTPVGDPPNVIIASNPYVVAAGVDFVVFLIHMLAGVVLSIAGAWGFLYLMLRKGLFKGSSDQMRDSIRNMQKNMAKLKDPTPSEENLRREILDRIEDLKEKYRRRPDEPSFGPQPVANFIETLAEMQAKYKLRNKPLLIKCCIALGFAILLFCLHSVPFMAGVTLAWAAFLAALLLLILADKEDLNSVLEHVEWPTLIFFASLFVFIEACAELGLIDWVGDQTIKIILSADAKHRTITAIMLVMWISAIFSAFVDNIPIVTMMLKLAIKLSLNDDLKIPLLPMIWALSYGVCFGGNATLIAASSNVVAAGIASQYGYHVTFLEFFKYGAPVTILSDLIATIYLLIAHGAFHWHR